MKFGSHVETRRKTRARESSRRSKAGLRVRISLRPNNFGGITQHCPTFQKARRKARRLPIEGFFINASENFCVPLRMNSGDAFPDERMRNLKN